MQKIISFFIFLLSLMLNAQQLKSLKILKTKYDSILNIAKKECLIALNENNQNKITETQKKVNQIVAQRNNEYRHAINDFLQNQKLAEPDNLPIDKTVEESRASYSLGFEKLYKEVYNYVSENYNPEASDYISTTSKIHFLVQNNNTLFIEKLVFRLLL